MKISRAQFFKHYYKINMPHKKIIKAAKKLVKDGIHPFTEQPDSINSEDRITPHDLFSFFTASIIKRKITFGR